MRVMGDGWRVVGGGRDGRCTMQGARMRRCDDATMLRAIERQRESVQKARPGSALLVQNRVPSVLLQ